MPANQDLIHNHKTDRDDKTLKGSEKNKGTTQWE